MTKPEFTRKFERSELDRRRDEAHAPAPGDILSGRMRPTQLGLIAITLLIGAVGYGAWRHIERSRAAAMIAERQRQFTPIVTVRSVKASGGVVRTTLPATIEAFETANIYARASGYVEKRYVDIGSRVKAGDKLVEISAPELDDQIRQAEAALSQAEASVKQIEANMELARVTNARTSVLAKQGWATRQQGDETRLNLLSQQRAADASVANVQAQRAQLNTLRWRRSYLVVLAPFDGVVTQRNIDVGSLVQADSTSGTFMFTVMRGNVVRVRSYVPQDQALGVVPGIDASVKVPEIPQRIFSGKVTRIADALEPGTRTLLAEIDVSNLDGAMKPGVYCTVDFQIPRRAPSFIVPANAVIFNQNGLQVAVAENGTARLRKVYVNRDFGTEVEVSEGVNDGDQVIVNPSIDLRDGEAIRIREEPIAQKPR